MEDLGLLAEISRIRGRGVQNYGKDMNQDQIRNLIQREKKRLGLGKGMLEQTFGNTSELANILTELPNNYLKNWPIANRNLVILLESMNSYYKFYPKDSKEFILEPIELVDIFKGKKIGKIGSTDKDKRSLLLKIWKKTTEKARDIQKRFAQSTKKSIVARSIGRYAKEDLYGPGMPGRSRLLSELQKEATDIEKQIVSEEQLEELAKSHTHVLSPRCRKYDLKNLRNTATVLVGRLSQKELCGLIDTYGLDHGVSL